MGLARDDKWTAHPSIRPQYRLALDPAPKDERGSERNRSSAWLTRPKKAIAFGMLLQPLNDDDRAHMKRVLPPPVRLLYPVLIGRPWKKYASTLRSDR